MCKTLHDDPSLTTTAQPTPATLSAEETLLPPELVKEILPYWREAAADLLRPRPEVVAALLEKISR